MTERRMTAHIVSIVLAVALCLFISIPLFLSGLEAENMVDSINMKVQLLFEGTLGVLVSVFNLANLGFVTKGKRLILSVIGACFLVLQGLHITESGAMMNGWLVVVIGIAITVLSVVGLVPVSVLARSRLAQPL